MSYYPALRGVRFNPRTGFGSIDWNALAAGATDALSGVLGSAVQSVKVETAYLPPLNIVGGDVAQAISSSGGGAEGINLGAILKPKITVQLAAGNPIVYAPYGDPGPSSWLPLIAVCGGALAIAFYAGRRSR